MSTMQIMDKDLGDMPIVWDPADPVQVEVAEAAFEKAKKKGMIFFKTKKDGSRGSQIQKFDPDAEKIIAAPQAIAG